MRLLRIATLTFFPVFSSAFGQEGIPQLPTAAKNELVKHCPLLKDSAEVALGDLNSDGIDDIATIVQCVESGSELNKIIVLMGTADGQFAFNTESAFWEPNMRRTEYISIKQKSIHITASTTSYTNYSGTSYKFILRDGAFILTGLDYSEGLIGDEGWNGISANFLTKRLITKRKPNKKSALQESHEYLKNDYKMPLGKFSLDIALDASSLR